MNLVEPLIGLCMMLHCLRVLLFHMLNIFRRSVRLMSASGNQVVPRTEKSSAAERSSLLVALHDAWDCLQLQ